MNPPTAFGMEQMQKALDAANARAEKAEAEIQQANEYLDEGWCPQAEADAMGGAPDGMARLAWRLHLSLRGALSGPEADVLRARAEKAEGLVAELRDGLHDLTGECGNRAWVWNKARAVLQDTAAAAEAHDQRVRRDARREALEELEAHFEERGLEWCNQSRINRSRGPEWGMVAEHASGMASAFYEAMTYTQEQLAALDAEAKP